MCKAPHRLQQCQEFVKLPTYERKDFVERSRLCRNCLGTGHWAIPRKDGTGGCPSTQSFKVCGQRHHTWLHEESKQPEHSSVSSFHGSTCNGQKVALVGTFIVNVRNAMGQPKECRVFIDPGADSNIITK